MSQRVFYVYYLRDLNNNIFYIGKGSRSDKYDRADYHIKYWKHHKNKHLFNKIKKLNGVFIVDVFFEGEEGVCLQLEMQSIEEARQQGIKLCNVTNGGEGTSGLTHTMETKSLLSSYMKDPDRISTSKDNIKKAQEHNKGKRRADNYPVIEMYETMSIQEISDITNLSFPTIQSYLKEKGVYVYCKNKKLSADHKEAIRQTHKARTERKKVGQYSLNGDLIKIWSHQKEAVQECGGCVGDCLRGRQKTAYGYAWKYE